MKYRVEQVQLSHIANILINMNGLKICNYTLPVRRPCSADEQCIVESSQALRSIPLVDNDASEFISESTTCCQIAPKKNIYKSAIQKMQESIHRKTLFKASNIIDSVLYAESSKTQSSRYINEQSQGYAENNTIIIAKSKSSNLACYHVNVTPLMPSNARENYSEKIDKITWKNVNSKFADENHPTLKAACNGNITYMDALNILQESLTSMKNSATFFKGSYFCCVHKKIQLTTDMRQEKSKLLKMRLIDFDELNEIHCKIANTILYQLKGVCCGLWISLGFKTNNLRNEFGDEGISPLLYMLYLCETFPQRSLEFYNRSDSVAYVYLCMTCCKVINFLLRKGKLDRIVRAGNSTLTVVSNLFCKLMIFYYESYKKTHSKYMEYCIKHYSKIDQSVCLGME